MSDEERNQIEEQQPDTDPGTQEKPTEQTFTQEQLNAILAEDRRKTQSKFADYTELKERAEKWNEHEEAQRSELEKAQAEAERLKQERDSATAQARNTLIKAQFVAEAAKAGIMHPEDAYALADKSAVSVNDDGNVIGVAEAVKTLVSAGRVPLAQRNAPGLDAGAGGNDGPSKDKKLTDEQLKEAQKMGIKPEDYLKYVTA